MMIVGMVSTPQEADDIAFITKLFVLGNRARFLGQQSRK